MEDFYGKKLVKSKKIINNFQIFSNFPQKMLGYRKSNFTIFSIFSRLYVREVHNLDNLIFYASNEVEGPSVKSRKQAVVIVNCHFSLSPLCVIHVFMMYALQAFKKCFQTYLLLVSCTILLSS